MSRKFTPREVLILSGLGRHTRDHAVDLLRNVPSLRLTSGRRSARRNAAVGGSPRSFHLAGRAIDTTGSRDALTQGRHYARFQRIGAKCTGAEENFIHDAGSGTHLHTAW